MNKQVVGIQNEHILDQIQEGHVFRARKDEWTDIPAKMYYKRNVPLTPAQQKIYNDIHTDLYAYIVEEDAEVSADMVLAKLEKLSQVLAGFVKSDDGREIPLKGGTGRTAECIELIEETGKVIIFTKHVFAYRMLEVALAEYNPVMLVGGMKADEIEAGKKTFNTDPKCGAIICQISAAKYGHTLVGSDEGGRCHNTVYFENTFSLDDRKQSEDRTNRFGQVHVCNYHDFISSPIDAQIVAALQRKEDIANRIVDGMRDGVIVK